MDYRDKAAVHVHATVEDWYSATSPSRVFALTVDGDELYTDMSYEEGDAFLFGPESVGLPDSVLERPWVTSRLRLPMIPEVRSLNLANSAAIVIYEAWRQLGFPGSR
jgi:tRNA (cytidine/uridine-2'-O-)-methyltransferase